MYAKVGDKTVINVDSFGMATLTAYGLKNGDIGTIVELNKKPGLYTLKWVPDNLPVQMKEKNLTDIIFNLNTFFDLLDENKPKACTCSMNQLLIAGCNCGGK